MLEFQPNGIIAESQNTGEPLFTPSSAEHRSVKEEENQNDMRLLRAIEIRETSLKQYLIPRGRGLPPRMFARVAREIRFDLRFQRIPIRCRGRKAICGYEFLRFIVRIVLYRKIGLPHVGGVSRRGDGGPFVELPDFQVRIYVAAF